MQALLRHRPFPGHGQQVAVAAGLQFLSLNGWRADLNPAATAVVVVEALASGRLTSDDAAAWLSPRLSPVPRVSRVGRVRRAGSARRAGRAASTGPSWRPASLPAARVRAGRAVAGVLLAGAVSGAALLAAACSRAPDVPASPPVVTTCAAAHHVSAATTAGSRPGACAAPSPPSPSK